MVLCILNSVRNPGCSAIVRVAPAGNDCRLYKISLSYSHFVVVIIFTIIAMRIIVQLCVLQRGKNVANTSLVGMLAQGINASDTESCARNEWML